MKKLALFITFLVLHTTSYGALSPFSQSQKEISDLLNEKPLKEFFHNQAAIIEIKVIDETDNSRTYVVSSAEQSIYAVFEYKANPKLLGPRSYSIRWSTEENN